MLVGNVELPMDRIAALCRAHGVTELSIFGSALRDDFGPDSDIDFLVTFENDDYGPWMSKLTDLEEALGDLLGRRVEVVPKAELKWVIRDRVLSSARAVYVAPVVRPKREGVAQCR